VAKVIQILKKFREPQQVAITKDELGQEAIFALLVIIQKGLK
jgi:hypothetical protein